MCVRVFVHKIVCVLVLWVCLCLGKWGKKTTPIFFFQLSRHHCMVKECGFGKTFFFVIVCKYLWVPQLSERHLWLWS